ERSPAKTHARSAFQGTPVKDYTFFLPMPSSAPVKESVAGSDSVLLAIALRSVFCVELSFTSARPSPPSTAGCGSSTYSKCLSLFQLPRTSPPCDMLYYLLVCSSTGGRLPGGEVLRIDVRAL